MAKYQQYEEYKDSGVEWLGEMPRHWIITKTSRFFKIAMGQTILKEDLVDDGRLPVFSATEGNHYLGRINYANVNLEKGDLVIPARGNSIGFVKIVEEPSTTTQTTIYCKQLFKEKLISKYVYYYFLGSKRYLFRFTQTAIPQITTEEVGNNTLIVPPVLEQHDIINFLDYQVIQIDTLIEKQQTLIQLLKEKRQAVISHAVTKGLNPDAPMKDSGVKWLGEVPEHWVVMQFRRITSLSQGLQIPQSERIHEPSKNNVEYITIKSIHAGDTLEHREYINKPSLRVQCDYDDVLLARTGATGEVITGVKGAFHNNFFKIDYSEKIDKNFLVNMLKVQELKSHLLMLAGTTTIPDLNHGAFLSTAIALPSLEEQEEICSEISRLSEKYNLLLEVAIKQVKLLQERRTALISAAVTGKIDVRGWRASE